MINFTCTDHLKLSEKTWFRILKKPVVISCMFGNEGILSAKSFGLGSNSFGKSFMYIRNNKGTKTVPYITLTLVFVFEDNLSFKAALYWQFFKDSLKDIGAWLLCCFLCQLCHTLLKACDMSRNIHLITKPLLKSKNIKSDWQKLINKGVTRFKSLLFCRN